MNWDTVLSWLSNSYVIKILAAIAELVIGFFLAGLVRRYIMRLKWNGVPDGVRTFIASLSNIAIRLLVLTIALAQIGIPTSILVGGFSAVGLGVSLALRESMANVAGGFQILITKPFEVGDYIACQSFEGTCEDIELMFTTLRTFDQQLIVIPNSTLCSETLTNYTYYPLRRVKIQVPIATQQESALFRTEILSIMKKTAGIASDPAPSARLGGYLSNGQGMLINVICFVKTQEYWDRYFDLLQEIQDLQLKLNLTPPVSLVSINPDLSSAPEAQKDGKDTLHA